MITRLALKGFKSFDDLDYPFAPMQALVGVNAAGKSNVFDALLLLGRTAQQDLMSAFAAGRGDVQEYFTQTASDYADQMTIEVDLLLPREVEDDWGEKARIKFNRLTYSIEVRRDTDASGRMTLAVEREELKPIKRNDDPWAKTYLAKDPKGWRPTLTGGRSAPFISTNDSGDILLHQDRHGGKQTRAPRPTRSILSGVSNTEFPHALAAKQAISKVMLLQLDPIRMRNPSSFEAPDTLTPGGDNLAAALARLDRDVPRSLRDITTETTAVVQGFSGLRVEVDSTRRLYTIWARQGEEEHSAQVLSDGTLRVIALAALKYDPLYGGTLLFEEPENGVHPNRLGRIASLLKALPSKLSEDDPTAWPRQVIVNTHSPKFMAAVIDEDLALVAPVSAIAQGRKARRSRLMSVKTNRAPLTADESDAFVARHEIERILETETLALARQNLQAAS